jgi:hypothetical protein
MSAHGATSVRHAAAPAMHEVIERELARILDATAGSDTSIQRAFDAKEAQVRILFDSLTAEERTKLHAALVQDTLPSFRRLTAERRSRILTALVASARRFPR